MEQKTMISFDGLYEEEEKKKLFKKKCQKYWFESSDSKVVINKERCENYLIWTSQICIYLKTSCDFAHNNDFLMLLDFELDFAVQPLSIQMLDFRLMGGDPKDSSCVHSDIECARRQAYKATFDAMQGDKDDYICSWNKQGHYSSYQIAFGNVPKWSLCASCTVGYALVWPNQRTDKHEGVVGCDEEIIWHEG